MSYLEKWIGGLLGYDPFASALVDTRRTILFRRCWAVKVFYLLAIPYRLQESSLAQKFYSSNFPSHTAFHPRGDLVPTRTGLMVYWSIVHLLFPTPRKLHFAPRAFQDLACCHRRDMCRSLCICMIVAMVPAFLSRNPCWPKIGYPWRLYLTS